jgi:hypothetical protein
MKKVLLLGLILAICILAMPQGALAADPVPVIINAQYGSSFVTTFNAYTYAGEGSEWPWVLGVGDNTNKIQFELNTLDDWTVTGSDTSGSSEKGFMKGSEHFLTSAFQVYSESEGNLVTFESDNQEIKAGAASTADQDWLADIHQTVVDTDYASSTPYTITLTFTCTTSF